MASVELEESPALEAGIVDPSFPPNVDPEEKRVGISEAIYANVIAWAFFESAMSAGLGFAFLETLIRLRPGDPRRYQPDVIYLRAERWSRPRRVPVGGELEIVPDIAVEVVSPTNTAQEIEGTVVAYLEAGVRLVWIVHPSTSRVYIHERLDRVRVITRDGELEGGSVIPGFRLAMVELFPPAPDPE